MKIKLLKDILGVNAGTVLEAEPTFNSQWKVTTGIDAGFNVGCTDAEEVEDDCEDNPKN